MTDNISMSTADTIQATVTSASDYYPFGLQMPGRTVSDTVGYRYGFNGMELDPATEWGQTSYDYGFRIYNPGIAKFLSVDPLTASYPMLTPYQFASNTPIQAMNVDGLEALIVTFPEYKADTELEVTVDFEIPLINKRVTETLKAPKVPSGHAGVLLIEPNGVTRYFEYGRYPSPDKVKGQVRKGNLANNVTFDEDGFPAIEGLNRVLQEISNEHGDRGPIKAAYIVTGQIQAMLDYAYGKKAENNDPTRAPYTISDNNCGTFAADCINQDPTVDQPTILIPTPNNIVEQYIEEGNRKILYDPKTNTTTVGEGNEEDAKVKSGNN